MNFKKIFEQITDILLHPDECWTAIDKKDEKFKSLLTNYALIVAAIPAICFFIGLGIVGIPVLLGIRFRVPVISSLLISLFYYIACLGIAIIIGFIIDMLSEKFNCEKNIDKSIQIAIYASTAAWISGLLLIIPTLRNLNFILSIYTLFLLYKGIEKIKKPEDKNLIPYVTTIIIAYIVVTIIILFIHQTIATQIIQGAYRIT